MNSEEMATNDQTHKNSAQRKTSIILIETEKKKPH
jgi:hypothetical protein